MAANHHDNYTMSKALTSVLTDHLSSCLVYRSKLSFHAELTVQLDSEKPFLLTVQNVLHAKKEVTLPLIQSIKHEPAEAGIGAATSTAEKTLIIRDFAEGELINATQEATLSEIIETKTTEHSDNGMTAQGRRSARLAAGTRKSWRKDSPRSDKLKKTPARKLRAQKNGNGTDDSPCEPKSEQLEAEANISKAVVNLPAKMSSGSKRKKILMDSEDNVDVKQFSCLQCEALFTNHQKLSKHKLSDHGIKKRKKDKVKITKCPECDYKSDWPGNIRRHILVSHLHTCPYCDSSIRSELLLKEHVTEKHPQSQLLCSDCGEEFQSLMKLVNHVKSTHRDSNQVGLMKCMHCTFSTLKRDKLSKHLESAKCVHCGDSVTLHCVNELKKHVQTVHKVKQTAHKVKQIEDKVKQTAGKVKTCPFCGKQYHSKNGYYAHRRLVHPDKIKTWRKDAHKTNVCHICGKEFPIWEYLKAHLKYHENSNLLKCPKCGREFKYRSGFKNHKEGCLNKSGFPCETCGKSYKNEHTLKLHIRHKHLRDPFSCRLCTQPFTYRYARNKHERTCDGSWEGTTTKEQKSSLELANLHKEVTVDFKTKFGKNMSIGVLPELTMKPILHTEENLDVMYVAEECDTSVIGDEAMVGQERNRTYKIVHIGQMGDADTIEQASVIDLPYTITPTVPSTPTVHHTEVIFTADTF